MQEPGPREQSVNSLLAAYMPSQSPLLKVKVDSTWNNTWLR